jgi:hypothetical protein
MKGINFGRVILGGLLAGVVNNIFGFLINSVITRAEHEETLKALGKTMPMDGKTTAVWMIMGFVFGIAGVWLYAAIRPRYGAGVGTAVRAGVAEWFFCSVYLSFVTVNLGLFPLSLTILILDLIATVIAVIAGAWLYKEAA